MSQDVPRTKYKKNTKFRFFHFSDDLFDRQLVVIFSSLAFLHVFVDKIFATNKKVIETRLRVLGFVPNFEEMFIP